MSYLKPICLFLLVVFFIDNSYAACNVALHAPAMYSPEPRYAHTKNLNDAHKLTDGRFAQGHFWTSTEATVGWQQSGLIRIDLDLQREYVLEYVTINTARGAHADVSFPARADIYFSQNSRDYKYGGNILEGQDLSDGPYLVKKFSSKLHDVTARYVTFFITPKGKFVFLDEIEILGNPRSGSNSNYPIPERTLKDFQKNILTLEHDQKVLNFLEARLGSTRPGIYHAGKTDRAKIFARNAARIEAQNSPGIVVWSGSPWDVFTPIDAPPTQEKSPDLDFHLLGDGISVQCVNIVSTLDHAVEGRIALIWDQPIRDEVEKVAIYECRPVSTRSGKLIGDPLEPVRREVVFTPGEARQFLLIASGELPGVYPGALQIEFTSGHKLYVPIKMQIYSAHLQKEDLPAANAWAYLTWRQIKNIPKEALDDLEQHRIDVGIIHPRQIPFPGKDRPRQVEEFRRAISLQKDKKNILLFFNFRDQTILNKFGNYQDRNDWNEHLKQWLAEVCSLSKKFGYDPEKLLFYPVDEPQNSDHVEKIINFSTVLKEINSTLNVYTTIDRISRLSKSDFFALANSCSVIQIEENDLPSSGVRYLHSLGKDVWVYSTAGGKDASSMDVYRLMAWRAFRWGASGIGFWAYADIGPEGTVWDDTDGARADYSVIYVEDQEIMSSKRWEAWRAGCEDYALLQSVERKLGESSMAHNDFYDGIDYIISHPDDYVFFEAFRIKLLHVVSN